MFPPIPRDAGKLQKTLPKGISPKADEEETPPTAPCENWTHQDLVETIPRLLSEGLASPSLLLFASPPSDPPTHGPPHDELSLPHGPPPRPGNVDLLFSGSWNIRASKEGGEERLYRLEPAGRSRRDEHVWPR